MQGRRFTDHLSKGVELEDLVFSTVRVYPILIKMTQQTLILHALTGGKKRGSTFIYPPMMHCHFLTSVFIIFMQIADALYYNAAFTLSILQKLGVATEIFGLWLQMLQQVKKSGMRANFRR